MVKEGEKMKATMGQRVFALFNYLILTCLVIVTLYPFWHIVMASFRDSMQLMADSGLL